MRVSYNSGFGLPEDFVSRKDYQRKDRGPPIVAADIINSIEYEASRRRVLCQRKAHASTKKQDSLAGHLLVQDVDKLIWSCCKRAGSSGPNGDKY